MPDATTSFDAAPVPPPRDDVDLVVRVRALAPSLPPAEQRVAARVVDDPARTSAQTISELARAAGTSETTVIRFCRALGLKGYPELRFALARQAARSAASETRVVGGEIGPGDDLGQVVDKIAFADARAVEETAAQLDLAVLERVVTAVAQARRVDLYGVGASAFVALDLQQKLHRIGLTAFAWPDAHMAMTSAALLGSADVAVGVSHSGETTDIADVLGQARERGATTVAITNFPRSLVATTADHVLTTAARETTFRSGATASRLAQLTVVDCVFVAVAQRLLPQAREALERTYDAVQGWRQPSGRGRR